jgi:glycosyltransferase involved in cell wall biosynthesis
MGRIDADLVVVGHGPTDPEATAALTSLGHRLHRLPSVDDQTLSALYTGATALLYPSFAEGFGLPVLEAMAHGTPVVTSARTATAEVAGGAALLVDPADPDDIAAAVEAAVFDPDTRRRLIHDGLIRAGQLTWDAAAKNYAEAFRSVL